MGFIDYHGNKEERYDDVLEYARAQYEKERRRLEDQKAARWMNEILKDNRYSELDVNEILKCIIVRFRNLDTIKKKIMLKECQEETIDINLLWNDFFVYTIIGKLQAFSLTLEQRNHYLQTFIDKIYKLRNCADAAEIYENLEKKSRYRKYFENCFDLKNSSQHLFYGWLHQIGMEEAEFYHCYRQLNVFLSYYFYLALRPKCNLWMQQVEAGIQVLDTLETDAQKNQLQIPQDSKLNNPVYGVKNMSSAMNGIENTMVRYLDKELFENYLKSETIPAYLKACKMLMVCDLPQEMQKVYEELTERLPVLHETIEKYKDIYDPGAEQFMEYYIPEALRLTLTYLEYDAVKMSPKIIDKVKLDVMQALKTLMVGINDKIDEIFKFVSIEVKAQAKALDAMMVQDGYVELKFKI